MRLFNLLLSFSLFALAACSSTPPQEVKKEVFVDPTPAPVVTKEFSDIRGSNFRGQYYLKNGKAYFKKCMAQKGLLVSQNLKLDAIYKKITSDTSAPVYIEFTGEIVFPENPNDKNDAIIRIDHLYHMTHAQASLQCAKPINTSSVKAEGENPYWRLNLDGESLLFATKVSNQVYQVNKTNLQTPQKISLRSINKQDEPLNVVIEANDCYNVKGDQYWGYTAKIDFIFEKMQGCAEQGWPKLENDFTGYYLNKTLLKETNLILNADNTVKYSEKADDKTIIKSGFWKNNTPNEVIVMFTKMGKKNIREEVIFNRNGLTLDTQKINKYNIVSRFDSPLFFKKMNAKDGIENASVKTIERNFTPALIAPTAEVDLTIQEAVNRYFKIHRTDPQNNNFNSVKYDLNGDGIEEAIVLLDWCAKGNCEMLIFEGLENGYKFSSRVSQVSAPITIAKTQYFSWQSLIIEKDKQNFRLDFDGISYPVHSNNSQQINNKMEKTGVILFSKGTPNNWFPISQ